MMLIFTQVADKIRRDERASVVERTNLRYLSELPQKVDLVTLDLSFISILLVIIEVDLNPMFSHVNGLCMTILIYLFFSLPFLPFIGHACCC